jgi:RNA polymerase sigma-70 factor (ECF subfamily)
MDPDRRPQSFEELYERECTYVWATLRRLGVRESDIEDVAHDLFLAVYRRLSELDPTRPVRPWLFGFCYRFASDHRKRAHIRREVAVESLEHSAHPGTSDAIEARALVLRALDTLDLDRRAVIVAHDIDGWTIPEVAASLGIPLNTAYSRLRLARADFEAAVRRFETIGRRGAGT